MYLKEFKMYKRLFVAAALVVTVSSMVGMSTVNAKHTDNTNEDKITICHRTNAANNPYVIETVSKSAANGGGHDDHTSHEGSVASSFTVATALKKDHIKWGDIIPAYTWNGTADPGLNWSAEGQLIYNNHCNYPASASAAAIDYELVCDLPNKRAEIIFTNTGTANGSATLNNEPVDVAADATVVKYVSAPASGTQITIKIDNVIVFDQLVKCEAGRGENGEALVAPIVPTTPITPAAPVVAPAGQSGQSGQSGQVATATDDATPVVSLPYTAGSNTKIVILVATIIATIVAVISAIVKSAYLKRN